MRYLVSVSQNALARKYIWEGTEALVLDHLTSSSQHVEVSQRKHPKTHADWKLVRRNGAIWIKAGSFERELNPIDSGADFTIPGVQNPIRIEVRQAQSPTPAFLPVPTATLHILKPDQSEFRIFHGAGGHCSGTLQFKKKYAGIAGKTKAFILKKNRKGYLLKARVSDLTLTRVSCAYDTLKRKETRQLTERDLSDLRVTWGLNWWRINSVAVNPILDAVEQLSTSEAELDQEWFKEFTKKLAIACAALSLVIMVIPKNKDKVPDDLPASTLVQLKKPKVIEKIVRPQSIPAPPKLESKPETKHHKESKHPKLQIAPKPTAQPTPPKPEPPKVDLAALARARAEAQAKAQAIAQANQKKADLAKSLSFLATAPQSKTVVVHDQSDTRFKTLAQAVPTDVSSDALKKLAKHTSSDGPIETSSARAMTANINVSGSKTMNEVQGRVAIASLASGADPSTSGIESELTSKGISVGGDGSLSQSEIEKALSKHLQRFQYCYEKALLSDASLAGHILAQWTIGGGGAVSNISIVRSQLNNTGLHQCLMTEISKVKFSSPQGGSVVVKYPFAFSSTPM
jgi:hypothetical protein